MLCFLNRLSSFASKQLTEGNAAFTDLSDKNRPTKIGERFGLIFDDEWSEAFEELTGGGMDDQSVISNLLQIIQVRQQLEVLFEIFVRPPWILSISFTFYYKNQNFKRNPYLQLCKICLIMDLLVLHVYVLFIIHTIFQHGYEYCMKKADEQLEDLQSVMKIPILQPFQIKHSLHVSLFYTCF